MPKRRRFLITGHPRSGTMYMSELFRAMGYDVGHEEVGADGISCAQWTLDGIPCNKTGEFREDYKFDYTLNVVRDPLKVIASTYHTIRDPALYAATHSDPLDIEEEDWLSLVVRTVCEWNARADLCARHVCVENAPSALEHFFHEYTQRWEAKGALPSPKTNSREHPDLTGEFIRKNVSREIWRQLEDHAYRYGYRL